MKKYLFLLLFSASLNALAQCGKKTSAQEKPPSTADMNKMMEEAMKDMSPEDKELMKKIMKDVPGVTDQNAITAEYPEFTSNKELVPKKDVTKIASVSKKKLAQSDISAYAATLYTKLMTKGEAAEIALVK